jgi:hypothetical protein
VHCAPHGSRRAVERSFVAMRVPAITLEASLADVEAFESDLEAPRK